MTEPAASASDRRTAAEEARRRARRDAARRLHPDRGGDPAAFDHAMRETERQAAPAPASRTTDVTFFSTRRARARRAARAVATRALTTARQRIPASWPGGRRRYGRL